MSSDAAEVLTALLMHVAYNYAPKGKVLGPWLGLLAV